VDEGAEDATTDGAGGNRAGTLDHGRALTARSEQCCGIHGDGQLDPDRVHGITASQEGVREQVHLDLGVVAQGAVRAGQGDAIVIATVSKNGPQRPVVHRARFERQPSDVC
jgi:hypothetical protein